MKRRDVRKTWRSQVWRNWVKAREGWRWAEIATGHDAMVMAPEELTRMLIEVAG
jgi:hypothetical protein